MAKRFTDTDKWKKPFIKALPSEYKLLWFYILDDCDQAGLWQVDIEVAQLRLGTSIDIRKALDLFDENIVVIDHSKWFVPSFIEFQYGAQLSRTNKVFDSIDRILRKYDLYKFLTVEISDVGTTPSAIRGRVSKKVKDKIFLKFNMTCQYCSEHKPIEELVVDHFIPIVHGGDNRDENLLCACVEPLQQELSYWKLAAEEAVKIAKGKQQENERLREALKQTQSYLDAVKSEWQEGEEILNAIVSNALSRQVKQ